MSDTAIQNMKISREGIVLIKSFEGFRPRAIQRDEGGWVIGYGHTLSAREGASVSEADAELLLRYDLLPVEKAVNDTTPPSLNQHQFDALVSFAFSVGLDQFAGSDVRERLGAGAPGEAADAMIGWPEPVLPESALRRRAAERALFTADPASPVALSDLLVSPLPLLPVSPTPEPSTEAEQPDAPSAPSDVNPRAAALAALLGEAEPSATIAPPVVVPAFETPSTTGSNSQPEHSADEAQDSTDAEPDSAGSGPPTVVEQSDAVASPDRVVQPDFASGKLIAQRFTPYSAGTIGPLPYLTPAASNAAPVAQPLALATFEAPTPSDVLSTQGTTADPDLDQYAVPAQWVDATQAIEPVQKPVTDTAVPNADSFPTPAEVLVLTPLDSSPEPQFERPLWAAEQRAEPASAVEDGLFGQDLALTQAAGPILRHEVEAEAPARFDWSETGAFVIMGAVGLTAFGAAMAAFRLASEQSGGGDETTIIAWVLAVIGAACVGVSSFNLYRRWGLPGAD